MRKKIILLIMISGFLVSCTAEKEYEKAWAAADQSRLEYKLAFATATRDSVVREDSLLTNDLRADMERKLLYQNILENEAKIKETP